MVRSGSSTARGVHGWLRATNSKITFKVSIGRLMSWGCALEEVWGSGFSLIVASRMDSRSSWMEGDRWFPGEARSVQWGVCVRGCRGVLDSEFFLDQWIETLGLALEYLIHLRNRPFSQLAIELRTLLNDHTASDHTKQFRDLTVTIYRTKVPKASSSNCTLCWTGLISSISEWELPNILCEN